MNKLKDRLTNKEKYGYIQLSLPPNDFVKIKKYCKENGLVMGTWCGKVLSNEINSQEVFAGEIKSKTMVFDTK
jgi:hypothetical protein